MNKLEKLEKRLEEIEITKSEDEKTKNFKFNDRKFKMLSKKSKKKPDYVLVQYLRNNRTIDFKLCRIISGNIIVIDNKGHELNPRHTWIRNKHIWYIIREKDTRPVSVNNPITGSSTDDHPVLIKMVLGAVQKKESVKDAKKIATIIIAVVILGIIGWVIFGG